MHTPATQDYHYHSSQNVYHKNISHQAISSLLFAESQRQYAHVYTLEGEAVLYLLTVVPFDYINAFFKCISNCGEVQRVTWI